MISVKNCSVYNSLQREAAIKAIQDLFKPGETGVCILLLIGLQKDPCCLLDLSSSPALVIREVSCFEVIVPATSLSQCPTCGRGERAEVMASHAEAALGAGRKFSRLLRSKTKKNDSSSVLLTEVESGYSSATEFE